MCLLNNQHVNILIDTGSNTTIFKDKAINLQNTALSKFNQRVCTAAGQPAQIKGKLRSTLEIGTWKCITDVLISSDLIRDGIIGLDILSVCPFTKPLIDQLREIFRTTNPKIDNHLQIRKNTPCTIILTNEIKERLKTLKRSPTINVDMAEDIDVDQTTCIIPQCADLLSELNEDSEDDENFDDTQKLCKLYAINHISSAEDFSSSSSSYEIPVRLSLMSKASEVMNEDPTRNSRQPESIDEAVTIASLKYITPVLGETFEQPKCLTSLINEGPVYKRTLDAILLMLTTIAISSLSALKTTTQTVTHTIKLKFGAKPLKQRRRRIAVQYEKDFDNIIEEMIESGKISPTTTSPWASPVRLLRKKDKSIRVTVDYIYLNSCTEKIAYPFPFVDEIFARLAQAKYYTVIDLISGYNQVPLDPESRPYTAFMTSKGVFQFNVLPMGVTNAVETFQRLMNTVLEGLIGNICEVYLDDIIVYSNSLEENM